MRRTLARGVTLLLVFVSNAAAASAQTGALVSGTVQYQQNNLPIIGRTTTILLSSAAACGQALFTLPVGTPAITTTATIVWTDPATLALPPAQQLICTAVQPPAATIFLLPLGANYSATMTFTNDAGLTSQPSTVSNSFTRASAALPPTVASVAPLAGAVGATVTLTGTNFTGATAVRFNGIAAATFTVVSATTITATVPPGGSSGPLSVVTPGGTGTSTDIFTVILPPVAPTGFQVRP